MKLNEQTMADQLQMQVEYKGRNAVKQHQFANGSPLVNAIYETLEQAVARFGRRIKIDDRFYALSAPFKLGYAAAKYDPRSGAGQQEILEYGLGYMKRLIEGVVPVANKTPTIMPKMGQHTPAPAALVPRTPPRPPRAPASGLPSGTTTALRNRVKPAKNVTPVQEPELEV